MLVLHRRFREFLRPVRPTRRRSRRPAVEGLDHRLLLNAGPSRAMGAHAAEVRIPRDSEHNGTVVKSPRFYEDYAGPRLAQFDAVRASGTLLRNGSFRFVGANQGVINPNVTATYVFGVDRNGHLPTGPFPGRPDVRFDATVAIKVVPGQAPGVVVTDLANRTTTTVPDASLRIRGKSLSVVVPGSLLPSTGLAPSQFRFNFWPEDGQVGSTHIASFTPETHDIRVGRS